MPNILRRIMGRLQRSGILSRPVRGIHSTFADWLETQSLDMVGQPFDLARHWRQIVSPVVMFNKVNPEVIIADGPVTFDSAGQGDIGNTYTERAKFVAHIRGGVVSSRNCELLTPDRWMIHELLVDDSHVKPSFVTTLGRLTPPRPRSNLGRCATVYSVMIRHNYSHFVLDCLPRICYLEQSGINQDFLILVPDNIPLYQIDLLKLMGYDRSRWHSFDGSACSFEHLYAPSFSHNVYWYPNPQACQTVRKRLLSAVPDTSEDYPKRIFISRKNSTFRRLINRDEILARLLGYGFVEICAEDYTVEEQIGLFRQAEVVVAPHGAGLTNILFMEPGTRVVELAGSWHRLPTYVNLAGGMGLRYAYVTTSEEFEQPLKNNDYVMPIERVREALEKLDVNPIRGS